MASKRGFTLIELLIVIGIIGFLAAAILVAVDPVKRIQDARNSKRWSEVNAILNAVLTKQVDDRAIYDGETDPGKAPIITQAGDNVQVIVRDDTGIVCDQVGSRPGCDRLMDTSSNNKNCVANIGEDGTGKLVPKYIAEIPIDPRYSPTSPVTPCGQGSGCLTEGGLPLGDSNTGYYIRRTSADNRIEIGACLPDDPDDIGVTIYVKR